METDAARHNEIGSDSDSLLTELSDRKRAEQVARGQTEALARTLDLLAAEPELDSFVGQVLKALTEQLGAQSGSFWLYDAARDSPLLRLDHDNAAPDPEAQKQDDSTAGVFAPPRSQQAPYRSATLQIFNDIRSAPLDEFYRAELLAAGTEALLVVPLVSGDDLIGNFTLLNTSPRHYQPEELELAQALAQQAVLAIQLTRLAEHRRQASVLEERNRIAREIHDTLAQAFIGILLKLRVAQRIAEQRPEEAWSLVERVTELAQEGLMEARQSVWDLQPDAVEYRDLAVAIAVHVERLLPNAQAQMELRVHGSPRDLPTSIGMDLFRIGQEAITNALRHARPQTVTIDLTFEEERVVLCVTDDGPGFDPNLEPESGGFGLVGMSQRAERLGGQLTVVSRPGHGTIVTVWAPILPTKNGPESERRG